MILLPDQMDKILQLYETMMTRHCTMIVGPTGGGKTVVLNTLIKAQNTMGLPTKCTTLNPKVFTNLIDFTCVSKRIFIPTKPYLYNTYIQC